MLKTALIFAGIILLMVALVKVGEFIISLGVFGLVSTSVYAGFAFLRQQGTKLKEFWPFKTKD